MRPVHYYAASCWYGLSQGTQSFINPFLPIYYSRTLGFTPSQIGLLAALRPWISAPAGSIAAALADRLGSHRFVLLFCFVAATALQSAIALVFSFPSQLALTLGISTVWTGASIIGDAAVMAASTHPGDYGRVRTWASVMWILISPLAGFMNEKYGMKPSIAIYCLGSILAIPAGWLLPLESLRQKERTPYITTKPGELEEPLLAAEEAAESAFPLRPPPSPRLQRREEEEREEERPTLAKALAIVRFIEAITELGAVPAPGSLYGFAEVATPYAVGHFKNSEFNWEREKEVEEGGEREENREIENEEFIATVDVAEPLLMAEQPQPHQLRLQVRPRPPPLPLPQNEAALPSSSSAAVALPRGMLSHAMSAGDLLRSVRDIRPAAAQPLGSSRGSDGDSGGSDVDTTKEERSEDMDSDGEEKIKNRKYSARNAEEEEEVHAWMPAIPDMEQPGEQQFSKQEFNEEGEYDGRSSALQRLTQIFTSRGIGIGGGDSAAATATVAAEQEQEHVEEAEDASLPPTPMSLLSGAGSPTAAGAAHNLLSGFTPVRNYLESRRQRLATVEQPRQTTAAAPAVVRAEISPELMREALDMEAAEIAGMDPTGSLVVDVLSKKLARMAAKEKRRQARKQIQRRRDEQQKKHVQFLAETTTNSAQNHNIDEVLSPTPVAATTSTAESASIWSRLAILFKDPGILCFFTIATLLGFGHGIIGTFLFMYLKHLGAGEGLMGWVLLANALPELPVFYFFGTILRVVGMDTLLIGSTAVLSLRIAAYSLFNTTQNNTIDAQIMNSTNDIEISKNYSSSNLNIFGLNQLPVQWMLLLETLHAVTYAIGWSACALNASKIAPPGLESTTQAVFQGLWSGIGAGTGGLLGGVLYHWKGPDALFLCSSGVIAVGCGVSGVLLGLQHKKTRYQRRHGSALNLLDTV